MSKAPSGGTLLIEYDGTSAYRVVVDGLDVSGHVTGLTVEASAKEAPELVASLLYGTVIGSPRFVARMVRAESEATK